MPVGPWPHIYYIVLHYPDTTNGTAIYAYIDPFSTTPTNRQSYGSPMAVLLVVSGLYDVYAPGRSNMERHVPRGPRDATSHLPRVPHVTLPRVQQGSLQISGHCLHTQRDVQGFVVAMCFCGCNVQSVGC